MATRCLSSRSRFTLFPNWVIKQCKAFPMAQAVKNQPAMQKTHYTWLILGSGRSPEGGNGNLLHYSCLVNPMDRGAWWDTVHRVTKSQTWLRMQETVQKLHYMYSKFIPIMNYCFGYDLKKIFFGNSSLLNVTIMHMEFIINFVCLLFHIFR